MRAVNKERVRRSFQRAAQGYDRHAVIQHAMADRLVSMTALSVGETCQPRVLEVGAGSGAVTLRLCSVLGIGELYLNDLVPGCRDMLEHELLRSGTRMSGFIAGDIESERLLLPGDLDLVVSGATLQWLEDLPGFFRRMAGVLKPGGLLAFSTFGPENLREIKFLESVGLEYHTLEEFRRMAAPWFDMVDTDEELRCLEFEGPEDVLRHMRATGVNGLDGARPWTRGRHRSFLDRYRKTFPVPGGVSLTYHAQYCCMKKTERG
ncbi:MAG: malonyl-ACP O-methyltransferase BioC [Prosthecochloris sp.]|nr:malonyl-ACP O-methyltransferase BioC [Prosthecochloris sp.]